MGNKKLRRNLRHATATVMRASANLGSVGGRLDVISSRTTETQSQVRVLRDAVTTLSEWVHRIEHHNADSARATVDVLGKLSALAVPDSRVDGINERTRYISELLQERLPEIVGRIMALDPRHQFVERTAEEPHGGTETAAPFKWTYTPSRHWDAPLTDPDPRSQLDRIETGLHQMWEALGKSVDHLDEGIHEVIRRGDAFPVIRTDHPGPIQADLTADPAPDAAPTLIGEGSDRIVSVSGGGRWVSIYGYDGYEVVATYDRGPR